MSTTDLIAFLRARLDEDEQWARAASRPPVWMTCPSPPAGAPWEWRSADGDPLDVDPAVEEYLGGGGPVILATRVDGTDRRLITEIGSDSEVRAAVAGHVARHDPARVLADIEAKRRIVDLVDATQDYDSWWWEDRILPLLALPYADHPDYREEWRP